MKNSLEMFLFLFTTTNALFGRFGPKNQNYQFKLKFGAQSNQNMQKSVVIFTFSVFDWKYPFWVNLIKKIKIVSLSSYLVPRSNLVPNLITQNSTVLFFFSFRAEIPILDKFGPKNQNYQFKLKFGTQTNLNIQNSMVVFHSTKIQIILQP